MVVTQKKNSTDATVDKENVNHVHIATTATTTTTPTLSANPEKAKITEVDKKLRELEDPLCSPNNVQKITFQDVTTAAFLIKGGIEYTPCPVIKI